jgi:hypothetical protein
MSEEAQVGAVSANVASESPLLLQSGPADAVGASGRLGHFAIDHGQQGIALTADETNWVKVGTVREGTGDVALALVSVGGETRIALIERLPPGDGAMLRLVPQGDHWVLEMSTDGVTWTALGRIAHPLAEGTDFAETPLPADWTPFAEGLPGPQALPHRLAARTPSTPDTAPPSSTPPPGVSVPDDPATDTYLPPTFARITLFHGDDQVFGAPGEGQAWINVLGNLSGDVMALFYSLNDGPLVPLSLGPDTRRLQNAGDFNIDIAYGALDPSPADDRVTILAVLRDGGALSETVTIRYEAGRIWPTDYTIDWGSVTDLQDVVQVVDGTWTWDDAGVRPADPGYDRLLVVGDRGWDNYELTTTVTIHDLENEDPRGRDGGAFAIGLLWGGHTDDPVPGLQPKSGWNPGASFVFDDVLTSRSYHNFNEILGTTPLTLEEGHSYNLVVRVEQTGLYDRLYSLKIWEVGTAEPGDWTLRTTEVFAPGEAPATGSIYLNAHYHDVTFGDIDVTEISGRDIVMGSSGDDLLLAVDPADALPGLGQIDVFNGLAGADTFIFADAGGVFYDDGIGTDPGRGDYGYIYDFTPGTDTIRLYGTAADYALTVDDPGLAPGTAIWMLGTGGDVDELIGLAGGVSGLDLASDSFEFV